jgi:hypothetical protein
MRACDEERFRQGKRTAAGQRPSMGQDLQKGRHTEIEFLNGLVVREGEKVGLTCRANDVLTDIVKHVERGELKRSQQPSSSRKKVLQQSPAGRCQSLLRRSKPSRNRPVRAE